MCLIGKVHDDWKYMPSEKHFPNVRKLLVKNIA